MLCHFIAYRHPGDPYDGEDDDNNDDDGNGDDGNYDIYIMMKCVFVCLSRKMSTSSWEYPVTT